MEDNNLREGMAAVIGALEKMAINADELLDSLF